MPISFVENGTEKKVMSPILLNKDIQELQLDTERYYPIKFDFGNNSLDEFLKGGGGATIFVKRKVGHLTYQQDPHGLRSLQLGDGDDDEREEGGAFKGALQEFTE